MFNVLMFYKRSVFSGRAVLALAFLALLLAGPDAARAQAPALGERGMNAAMLKLFGGNTAFTAHAEFVVYDKQRKETDRMPANYAFLDGNVRMDIDMSQVKSAEVPSPYLDALKQMSMDQTVVITRPDRKVTYSIYPRAKAYAEIPMPKEETAVLDTNWKLEKSPLGKETIDGHSCQKDKVTFTGDKGQKAEATVWSAADLKDFPVQIQMAADADTTVLVKFRDLKLTLAGRPPVRAAGGSRQICERRGLAGGPHQAGRSQEVTCAAR